MTFALLACAQARCHIGAACGWVVGRQGMVWPRSRSPADQCDPATGGCSATPIPDCGTKCKKDADCDDGNPCTLGEICVLATCGGGQVKPCDDGNACTTDACAAATGQCAFQVIAGCGAKCTSNADCSDQNMCTFDTCNPYTGACIYTNIQGCVPQPQCQADGDCDDNQVCTVDYCNVFAKQCVHVQLPGCK